ncbi:MAG: hypothetical protein KDK70_17185 [Myxococcales bacterium]|nr:hypothetical protein [Myxococcales bacterium]
MRVKISAVLIGCTLGISANCAATGFVCADASECLLEGVQGRCEADGWCSFPDEACPSGHRYGKNAGDGLGGACTEEEGTGSSSASSTTAMTPMASTLGDDGSGSSEGDSDTSTGGSSVDETGSSGVLPECPESEEACDAWFLPNGAKQWEPATIGGPEELRPEGPVLAAFDIEAQRRAFVVTPEHVLTLDLEERAWTDKRPRAELFSGLGNEEILAATSLPADWPPVGAEKIRLTTAESVHLYLHDETADTFVLQSIDPTDAAPGAPEPHSVTARWVDVYNDGGWVEGDLLALCGVKGELATHSVTITDGGSFYVRDLGPCSSYFPPLTSDEFVPSSLPQAPPVGRIGAACYNQTTGLVWLSQ